ncbi:putative receptor-like protein kinase At3g47110 [Jatropha curcas]|uniref:putative receptor-like protein kinase At3g47110 n=1 Tax=Jatropha curcas TaxID=180498 RepID=UPI0005FB5FAD|nr:putative receptor-like protein kinase At3g47110 [Jatropha curcas]
MELPLSLHSVTLLTSLLHVHVLFLICTSILRFQTADCHKKLGNETDRLALLEFKAKIGNDPYGILSSWNGSLNFCKWQGVTCSRKHQRVTSLNLQGLSLSGVISPSVGNLTFLRFLNLGFNELNGEIPPETSHLFRLRYINLTDNALKGEIPINISYCSELKTLDLSNNRLVGKIPSEIGSLKKLLFLALYKNNLTGEIPRSLGNLSSLQGISISYNKLRGNIPNELGRLKSLRFFLITVNNLTGTVPSSIYNISSMTLLSLTQNQLKGSVPPNIGLTLPNLQVFQNGLNQFHGTIPISLANASQLEIFSIPGNFFTGEVPTNVGDLNSLRLLNLEDNFLGNNTSSQDLSFLAPLSNCSNLRKLSFAGNNFGGVLPSSISNMSSLFVLNLGTNQISGKIPAAIGNLVNLYQLGMEENLFSGPIPISLGKNQQQQMLYLHTNKLSGEIPASLGNISQLYHLLLYRNKLEGNIPSSLGHCTNLHLLDAAENNLTGIIPQQIIGMSSLSLTLNLSHNSLIGPIPLEVGKLTKIVELDISDNKLSGEIPKSIGDCLSLEILNMQGNFLQGPIPLSIGSLRGLQLLDLSRNKLSGNISKELEKLLFLQYLNLSFNNLSGEVPRKGVFSNLNTISLIGNNDLCGGIPKLKLPVCPVKQMKHRSSIVRILATTLSSIALSVTVAFFSLFYWRKSRKSPPSTPFLAVSLPRISYNELLQATGGFSSNNLIGQGSFGSVYRGSLTQQGERLVAVKVLNLQQHEASKSFIAECKVLRNVKHRNLVKVLTYCSSIDFKGNDFKALVFDFMAKGSLEMWLHPRENNGNDQSRSLNLLQRLQIAIDVASALHYLHDDCEIPIIHCDLKPSNILLDDEMTAHVSDFGLARLWSKTADTSSQGETSSIGMKGTIGYMAPEYGVGNAATTSGDTYSFGIILLEIFTGKRPTDEVFANGLNLHNFVKTKLPGRVDQIVDAILLTSGDIGTTTNNMDDNDQEEITIESLRVEGGSVKNCLVSVLKIGVACSEELPEDRMNMKNAARKLNVIKDSFLRARNPRDRRKTNPQIASKSSTRAYH